MIKKKINKISIKIASCSKVIEWSYGEITNIEIINYKNLKPEKFGLFCLKTFSNMELCCEKDKCDCNKKDTFMNLKRAHIGFRLGHIRLQYPCSHILFLKSISNGISSILDLSYKILEKIINFKIKIVVKSFIKKKKKYDLLELEEFFCGVLSSCGAKCIRSLLSDKELLIDCRIIKKRISKCESYHKLFHYLNHINKIYIFYLSGNKPKWMILLAIPVVPPKIRPMVPLSSGKFASSDINEIYKRILIRNTRLKKLKKLGIPKNIIISERILLQESVDSLFDNERLSNPIVTSSKRILKSFSGYIKGKYGRFRQNLLGKRVDFSGRTVITVGPNLLLNQCEIPILIALELFKPFIFRELKKKKLITTLSLIDEFYKNNKKIILLCLKKIIKNHTVLLNRAPTLHRMGIQSFNILLTEDKSIKLHPLVCLSYNADFDGDQMAVHIPLTINSQIESKILLMSYNNILSPANGIPIIIPTQDMIIGIYTLTLQFCKNKIFNFCSTNEIVKCFYKNNVSIYDNIKIFNLFTTVGRIILFKTFDFFNLKLLNKIIKKKYLTYLIKYLFDNCNFEKVLNLLDKLKKLGFYYATFCGVTIGLEDIKSVNLHSAIIKIFKKIAYKENYFLAVEVLNKLFLKLIIKKIGNRTFIKNLSLNNLFLMLDSGSRGSMIQVKQLIAFRGFFSKSNGEIILNPIINNLRIGLNMKEYFITTYGARKGLTDTSLKTANSGYLTRKLVDVLQDIVIYKNNCYSKKGIEISLIKINSFKKIYDKIYGRVISEKILLKNKIIFIENTIINNKIIYLIIKLNIKKIFIKNCVFCISTKGVCAACYGFDLSTNYIVNIGVPVGIIAAQSIGEPGTQLTMRTFHTGGVVDYQYKNFFLYIKTIGFCKINNCKCVLNNKGELIILSINGFLKVYENNKILKLYKLYYGDKFFLRNGLLINRKIKIINDEIFSIFSENSGFLKILKYEDFVFKYIINKKKYHLVAIKNTIVEIILKKKKKYFIPKKFFLLSMNNKFILNGDIIAQVDFINSNSSNIIGGLPRLSELFEAKEPKIKAIISEIDGKIKLFINNNCKIVLIIFTKFGISKKYFLELNRKIYVNNNDKVKIGDILTDGELDLNDVIKFLGIDYLVNFFINEVNNIYNPQGVFINSKHIELVLRQMTKKVKIIYSGDCFFLNNDILTLESTLTENINTVKNSKRICYFERLVIGITKTSLDSVSFFSAASFQETNKILIDAAIKNRNDYLSGLKENVLIGRLIPAGTGLDFYIYRKVKKSKTITDVVIRKNLKACIYTD